MNIDCSACVDGTDSSGKTCYLCGGSGVIELTSETFKEVKETDIKFFMRKVWLKLLTDIANVSDKCDEILEKMPGHS